MSKQIKGHMSWLLCALLIALAGCVRQPTVKSPLVGKWQRLDAKFNDIEFLADGTIITTKKLSTQVLTKCATYKVVDDTHIVITTKVQQSDAQNSDIFIEYHISGNQLTMKYPNKLVLEFEKIE